jgi:hypothetical protein
MATPKPAKTYAEFPLFPHTTKRWAKKIRGKLHDFGPWADPDAALRQYPDQRDDIQAGRKPRHASDTPVAIKVLGNPFLLNKATKRDSSELSVRMFLGYHRICVGSGSRVQIATSAIWKV